MHPRTSLAAFSGAITLLALVAGCPDDDRQDGEDDGGKPTTTDGGTDGGTVDAGPPKCTSDLSCAAEEYCEISSGNCLPARACRTQPAPNNDDCWTSEYPDSDYCAFGGCFCDPDRGGGRCRPRFKPCQDCTRDLECGSDDFVYLDYQAKCVDFQGAKVCLPQRPGVCPPGFRVGEGSNCVPGSGSCGDVSVCTKDEDCTATGAKPMCDTSRGFCIPSCLFDYRTGASDCAPGQVCHVDPRLLDADNLNFGGGKCGPTCDAGGPACPEGTSCELDGDPAFATTKVKRCRPGLPKCIRDEDCPPDDTGHSRGYCDRGSLTCKGGCRVAGDCFEGYKCIDGQCTQKTCIEGGGARLSCSIDQFCCGEQGGPQSCGGVQQGECYDAPRPPWCQTCDEDGKEMDAPGDMIRPGKSICLQVAEGQRFVLPRCIRGADAMCPGGRGCERLTPACDSDDQCGNGGKCIAIDANKPDQKECTCEGGAACPEDFQCETRQVLGVERQLCSRYYCITRFCAQQ